MNIITCLCLLLLENFIGEISISWDVYLVLAQRDKDM